MNILSQPDLMNILEYEKVRDDYRKDIISYKKDRRISLGPNITITFENKKTMLFQIQEIMRSERLVHEEQIQEEIDIYNSIMPPANGLSATLFIEITEESQIKPVLNSFIGLTLGDNLWFSFAGERVIGEFEGGREESDKISSVHYVKFHFTDEQKNKFLNNKEEVELVISYKDYQFGKQLSEGMKASLRSDLI